MTLSLNTISFDNNTNRISQKKINEITDPLLKEKITVSTIRKAIDTFKKYRKMIGVF
jgi:hypothetical protein